MSINREVDPNHLGDRWLRLADYNSEIVDRATNIARLGIWGEETIAVPRTDRKLPGVRIHKNETVPAVVRTSPLIAIEDCGEGRYRAAVVKIDQVDRARRARVGFFFISADLIESWGENSAMPEPEAQEGDWLTTYMADTEFSSHRKSKTSRRDYLLLEMTERWWFRGHFLKRVKERLMEVNERVEAVNKALETNVHNRGLYLRFLEELARRAQKSEINESIEANNR